MASKLFNLYFMLHVDFIKDRQTLSRAHVPDPAARILSLVAVFRSSFVHTHLWTPLGPSSQRLLLLFATDIHLQPARDFCLI